MNQHPETESTKVVGELTEEEKTAMLGYQRQMNQLMYQLGELALHQNGLLLKASSLEMRAAEELRQVGNRLGLEKDQLFKVVEGKVVLFEQNRPLQIVQTPQG